jgi:hypothetical protein
MDKLLQIEAAALAAVTAANAAVAKADSLDNQQRIHHTIMLEAVRGNK